MSAPSVHDDWLSLIEISGPFLAVPVLKEAFPQGLEELDTTKRKRLRQAYEEWREALELEDAQFAELHVAWIDEVLSRGLALDEDGKGDVLKRADWCIANLQANLPEHGVTLSPALAVVDEQRANKPLLLIQTYAQDVDLDATLKQDGWAATPADRMVQLCRSLGCRLGLVTNGERWMLVDAPVGAVTTFASWYARIWSQEPITLQAFVHLLGIRRFFVDESEQLPALFDRSLKFQDEVTDALGEQVRRAVEVLIQTLDKADQDRNRELLHGVKEPELYEAALTVMMRLVFLLSAEERGLLLMGDERYEANYALSTLRMQLRKESEEILERRWDAWSRLLAIFRAVFGGIEHENLRLPALGGSLFDPDRFPFLEGRAKGSNWRSDAAKPLPIDNRTVLLLLEAIQQFQGRTLSYRALDVEQIGYVYEGLLERTVKRTDEVTLELDATKSAKTPWIKLAELDSARLEGAARLAELLQERSGSSVSRVRNDLAKAVDDTLADRLLTACQGDTKLRDRVKPYAHLLRTDPWGYPLVYPAGAFIVTTGSDRRETGTHYTPKSLTEAIVAETLTPVAYVGPAEGTPRDQWVLKSPVELLNLKICDPAMGSGAFLVQACRWLSDRLVESWAQVEASGKAVSVDGEVLDGGAAKEPLPRDSEARTVIARCLIAERCLYGVDLNPLAVELAKLSIWLVTLAKGRPFGFLDPNLRCGDSLLGIHKLEQLTRLSLHPEENQTISIFASNIEAAVKDSLALRRQLRETPIRDIRDIQCMEQLDREARNKLEKIEHIANAMIGVTLASGGNRRALDNAMDNIATWASTYIEGDSETGRKIIVEARRSLAADLSSDKSPRKPFHWVLEFPEVFEQGGFDGVIGNPPFLGGLKLETQFGTCWRQHIVDYIASGIRGNRGTADLCAYFFLRSSQLSRVNSCLGLIGTSTVAEGDSHEVGLSQLVKLGLVIYESMVNLQWPGSASVKVSMIWLRKGNWSGPLHINNRLVRHISSTLKDEDLSFIDCHALIENENKVFMGATVLGTGFVLSHDQAKKFISLDSKYTDVIHPFLNGDDVNSHPESKASRSIVCFSGMSLERASKYELCFDWLLKHVKPERDRLIGKNPTSTRRGKNWWLYAQDAKNLFANIKCLDRVIVRSGVSKFNAYNFVANGFIPSHAIFVFAFDDFGSFSLLQSTIYDAWVEANASSLGATLRYTPTTCFENFPFPFTLDDLTGAGKEYWECRTRLMKDRDHGMTEIYNDFHDENSSSEDICLLRTLHVNLDAVVIKSYGWDDLNLDHGFLNTKQGIRFTISEAARIEVLRRLSELNRQRYEEEVAQGVHSDATQSVYPRATRARRTSCTSSDQPSLDFESGTATPVNGVTPATAILGFLDTNDCWHAKADVLAATGITDGQWNTAIAELLAGGKVERQGERRGARYRATVVEGAAQ